MPFYQAYFNPYSGQSFPGFFIQLFKRIGLALKGEVGAADFVSDEIQIIILLGVAASCALVGCFLVLRKTTMLANSLSHTILLGIVIAFWLNQDGLLEEHTPINIKAMLLAALLTGLATTFLTEFLTKVARLQEDASIGIVFTSLFALGIILVTLLTRNAHIGTEVVMGNVDALHFDDFKLVYLVLAMNVAIFFLFFKEFKITTFDPAFAKSLGIFPIFFGYLLMAQVSTTAIGAFRAVGVLMVLAFITGPVLTARLLTHDLKKMLFTSVALGCLASIIGVALSRHILSVFGTPLSTAGVVVCVIVAIFILVLGYKQVILRIKNKKSAVTRL